VQFFADVPHTKTRNMEEASLREIIIDSMRNSKV
jgi:hypothetical protein